MKCLYTMAIVAAIHLLFFSCDSFLEERPYNTLAHPTQLKDLRAMLDYEPNIHSSYPGYGEVGSDDFQTGVDGYAYMLPHVQDMYIWEDKGLNGDAWRGAYNKITTANVILESLSRIKEDNIGLRNQLEGEALFMRGWMLFNLAQVYCAPFSVLAPNDGLGLVLRLDSDSEVKLSRSTLTETYQQIFSDIGRAVDLLPEKSGYIMRPSKVAALAALARAYLTIEDYNKAEEMVDRVLDINDHLLDFNKVDALANVPLSVDNNIELLNYGTSGSASYLITHASTIVNPELYDLYDDKDLRKQVFFDLSPIGAKFKGFYHGNRSIFFGLAIDEMYLIKAECAARRSDVKGSVEYLNELLDHRYERGYFEAILPQDKMVLLKKILEERRKELIFRGIRWLDLRRLNRYPEHAKTLYRNFESGKKYEIKPNDLRYTLLIPIDAIDIGGYQQNPR